MNINELARGSAQSIAAATFDETVIFSAAHVDETPTIHCDGISEQLAEHIT